MIDPILLNTDQPGKDKKSKLPIIIVIVLVIAAIVGGIYMFQRSKKTQQTKVAVVEKKEPSPTEKPKIDKKSVKIQVLNGTGTPGQAALAVEALKKAGYNPDNIKSANAKDFNNTKTSISAKDGFNDVAVDMKDALNTTFSEIKIDSASLSKDSEFDIIITTGGKKFEQPTPTKSNISPSPNPTTTTTSTPSPSPTLTPTPTP